MSPKLKKILLISGISLDVAVTVFLFVIAIIMLATAPKTNIDQQNAIINNGPFIGYLQQNTTLYLWTCVVPLFVLLAGNVVLLVLYVKKAGKTKAQLSDLSEDQKAALRAEILKDMDSSEEKPEEKK